jgi:hypothetical protein
VNELIIRRARLRLGETSGTAPRSAIGLGAEAGVEAGQKHDVN